jgi:DNA-binding GntR family transcriptional regulator
VVTGVFEQILAAVHRGELKPGQRISDADLADEFGVSRTPVREALQRLREIGIIEASPSRFTRVADVSARQMIEALIVWGALYDALLDETVPLAEPSWADQLEEHGRAFDAGMTAADAEQMATANFLFYDVLARHSSNPVLQRSITGVVHIVRLGARYLVDFIDPRALADAHAALIAAVRDQDVDAARASLRAIRSIRVPAA